MIFRQLFEPASCTYPYLSVSRRGSEALIIDPVLEKVDRCLQLMREQDAGLNTARHIQEGIDAWKRIGGALA